MARKAKVAPAIEKLDVKRQKINLDVHCGDCMFFKKAGVYRDSANVDRSCEGFGTVAGADPCRWFTANSTHYNHQLGNILKILSSVERPQVLAAALLSARRLKRHNLTLGQKVYFHVMGGEYLCNYASGLVVGAVKEVIVVESDGYVARLKRENLLVEDTWRSKVASLLKSNQINDPDGGLRRLKTNNQSKLMLYEPQMVKYPFTKKQSIPSKKQPKSRIITLTSGPRQR